MATHSSVLAWRIPGMGEPGGLQSMGLHRVRHNWSNLAAAATHTSGKLSYYYFPDFVTAICLGFIFGFLFLDICFNLT